MTILILAGCGSKEKYAGSIVPAKYTSLAGKRIFIDPGHGGKGSSDQFRTGPGGITEENINLQVSLILSDMLKKAGAKVLLSRSSDKDISLEKRSSMANEFNPQVLVSIHHNGSTRASDGINYPSILIWGTADVNPASKDLADLLLEEFDKAIEIKGKVFSDFAVFHETGTHILRETRTLCPAVLGEFGFYSDETHAIRLRDKQYLDLEAESYFIALSRYFERGIPGADILVSCQLEGKSTLKDNKPRLCIKISSGNEKPAIEVNSLNITIDDVPVNAIKLRDDLYQINYGKELHPGGHMLRFTFRNMRHQSSMVLYSSFFIPVKKGDYDRLLREAKNDVRSYRTRHDGLLKLMAAYSMGKTDPGADKLLVEISNAFFALEINGTGRYYIERLNYFYPGSQYNSRMKNNSYRFPVDFYGKALEIQGNAALP